MKVRRALHPPEEVTRFRRRLLIASLTVVTSFTMAALMLARRGIARDEEQSLEREFQTALATLHHVQDLRHAALVERCRTLARRPRLHAALEDGALDLLYLSARDELRDAVAPETKADRERTDTTLRARFYRFLDADGQVLPPPADDNACGPASSAEERSLVLSGLIDRAQTGYVAGGPGESDVTEIIATPILSSETGMPISVLVLGFEPVRLATAPADGLKFASGVWAGSRLSMPTLAPTARVMLHDALQQRPDSEVAERFRMDLEGSPYMVFYKHLNPGSPLPTGHEVFLFPLADMETRQRRVTWQILGVGAFLLLGGLVASHLLAGRFSKPVARLADDSRDQRTQRQRAEAALESTHAELERVARFSADASHQLKTPVTVLRAGLEEVLARGAIPAAEIEEISTLIHQTYRLSTVIEDLLLLSRLDAGQLKISFGEVDLGQLIEASLDDLGASPDAFDLAVECDCPHPLRVAGERRYIALILQNLLENARKYNLPAGRIRIAARAHEEVVALTIGNTARRPIPREAQPHIFERFHRGAMGENVPGYGIGLNLARELARLHDGDLRLLCSDETWTEFEVTFRSASPAS